MIGGVLWDAHGNNLTRGQVEAIPGTIPTVTIGSVPDAAQPEPSASLIGAVEGTTYGVAGNASAPRLWMFFDPKFCSSVRAMQPLQPLVASGRVQLARPGLILDHEDAGSARRPHRRRRARRRTEWPRNGPPDV